MGINMAKVLQQKAELEQRMARGGGGGNIKWWKPANGQNVVRILPPWSNEGEFEGQFWRQVAQHWNVSEDSPGPVICPKQTPGIHEDCPICDFVEELKSKKKDAAAQALRSNLRAKLAFFLNIIDRKDPTYTTKDVEEWESSRPDQEMPFAVGDAKIQVWACQPTIFDQILASIQVNEMDVTSIDEGNDFIVIKHYNKADPKLTRYECTMKAKPTKAGVPADVKLHDLSLIGKKSTYEELQKLLATGEAGDYAAATGRKLKGSNTDDELPAGYLSSSTDTDETDDADELMSEMNAALGGD